MESQRKSVVCEDGTQSKTCFSKTGEVRHVKRFLCKKTLRFHPKNRSNADRLLKSEYTLREIEKAPKAVFGWGARRGRRDGSVRIGGGAGYGSTAPKH